MSSVSAYSFVVGEESFLCHFLGNMVKFAA